MKTNVDRRAVAFLVLLGAFTLILGSTAIYVSSTQNSSALGVTQHEFDSVISGSNRVAVFFSAAGCAGCNEMRPLWQALETQYSGSITFIEVRYSVTTSALFDLYNVTGTPTFYLFVGGVAVAEHPGTFSSPQKMSDFLQSNSSGEQPGSASSPQTSLLAESPSLLLSALLGLGVFASPCVLPLLPGYVGFLVGRGKGTKRSITLSSASSFAAGAAGILLIGGIFIVVGDLFWAVLLGGRLIICFALMALGLAAALGIGFFPSKVRIPGIASAGSHVRGIASYALLYGLLSIGCSIPFVIGGILNVLAGVGVYSMVSRLLVFAFGFSAPLAVLTYAVQRGVSISAARLGKSSTILQRVGGAAMVAASIYLAATL